MSLQPFGVLNVVVALLSMQGQKKALGFHKKLICVLKVLQAYTTTRGWVINDNFHFWVNYPLIYYQDGTKKKQKKLPTQYKNYKLKICYQIETPKIDKLKLLTC